MTGLEGLVIVVGLMLIGVVNWWFFWADRAVTIATAAQGIQQATVIVDGGYDPSTVQLTAGTPTRLVFDRRDEGSCSEEVLFPDFGIRRFLPPHQLTTIEIPAATPGTYEFVCGMRMLRGRLEVVASPGGHHG
jgi:plastocyanin domain-containing protein